MIVDVFQEESNQIVGGERFEFREEESFQLLYTESKPETETSGIFVYPNPSNQETIFVDISDLDFLPEELIVTDIHGKIEMAERIETYSKVVTISTTTLPAGTYFVVLKSTNSDKTRSCKFVVTQ